MARFPMYGMAGIGIAAAIGFVFILNSISSNVPIGEVIRTTGTPADQPDVTTLAVASTQKLNKFASIDELKAFLLNTESVRNAFSAASSGNEESLNFGLEKRQLLESTAPQSADSSGVPASVPPAGDGGDDYSTTNVQVESVDEPDFIKNDGKYAYVLSGDKLTIAEIYPARTWALRHSLTPEATTGSCSYRRGMPCDR